MTVACGDTGVCLRLRQAPHTPITPPGSEFREIGLDDEVEFRFLAVAPEAWRTGIVTSPHGITFDGKGNILETEWNQFGRVLRWDAK